MTGLYRKSMTTTHTRWPAWLLASINDRLPENNAAEENVCDKHHLHLHKTVKIWHHHDEEFMCSLSIKRHQKIFFCIFSLYIILLRVFLIMYVFDESELHINIGCCRGAVVDLVVKHMAACFSDFQVRNVKLLLAKTTGEFRYHSITANTINQLHVGLRLGQRRGRWSNVKPYVFGGLCLLW